MAQLTSPVNKNCNGKSIEPTETENETDESYPSINNLNKKEKSNDRSIFYKKPIKKDNYKLEVELNETPQEIRRQQLLYYQKKNRDASFNVGRGLLEDIFNSENEEEMEEEEEEKELEEMEIEQFKKKRSKFRRDYANMLMLSEWMLEVPQDFAEKWIMVPCPEGKRVLIIAFKGLTKMYTRRGLLLFTFKSILPGGNSKTQKNSCTILDCIWLKDKEICYALDVLAWSNQVMSNCEAEFRFYWLRSQLEELSEIKEQKNGINDYPILTLPAVNCNQDFYECLENISTSLVLDGLLFYHKESHYVGGRTPLVAWLKTYMLPEVLSMNVPEPYDEKPSNYIDFKHHELKVMQIEKKRAENMQKRKKTFTKSEQEDME